jgi:MFS family permease
MLSALFILMVFVNEPKLREKQAEYEREHPEDDVLEATDNSEKKVMPKPVKKSLIFLLLSVAFWYIGYNAVSTWFTTYATTMWGMAVGEASLCLTIATAGAIVSYIPVGAIASKIGRKITIKFGAGLLAICFLVAFLYTLAFNSFNWSLYILFILVGVAWASINVNSLPMVVEMCSSADVGKFTGFYYTFSMAAQTVTPILAGALIGNISYKLLFVYSAVFVALSFVTMCFVNHGDTKIKTEK